MRSPLTGCWNQRIRIYGTTFLLMMVLVFFATKGFDNLDQKRQIVNIEPVSNSIKKLPSSFRKEESSLNQIKTEKNEITTKSSQIPITAKPKTGLFNQAYQVFTINQKPVIWAFWDTPNVPALLKLSLASVKCHNSEHFDFRLLELSNIYDWIDHVHPAFPHLIPAHKADYFRARILDEYGGIYVDADSIGFGSFQTLFKKLLWYDLVNLSWPPDGDKIAITTMGPMRARSKFTSSWVTDVHILLDSKYVDLVKYSECTNGSIEYPLEWSELLRDVVEPLVGEMVAHHSLAYFSLTGQTAYGQLVMSNLDPLAPLEKQLNDSFKFMDTELLMYHNSQFPDNIRSFSIDRLLRSETLIMELLRMAFAKCRTRLADNDRRRNGAETADFDEKFDDSGMPKKHSRVLFVVPDQKSSLRYSKDLMNWIRGYVGAMFPSL